LKYVRGLAAAAQLAGCTIHENSRVLRHERIGSLRLVTDAGLLACRQVVYAGNAWLGATVPALARRIIPVGTYIVATEPLGEAVAQELLPEDTAITDINWVLDYFRRSSDHRLLFGGRVSYSGLDPFDTAKATRQRMLAVFPQLQDAGIEHAWGGYVDITLNRAPDFGRIGADVYYLQGFSGHGIALTGLAGKLVAEAIAGTTERFDVFAQIPHREFPGGTLLRRPALVLAMLYYRLRDLL
jgi:gamma-glutamylputrescine oxidase